MLRFLICFVSLALWSAYSTPQEYDIVIRNGTIYDGSGSAPFQGDLAIQGDTIAAVGSLGEARGRTEIEAEGLAVAPGFINMLSWATESLIEDGRSQSGIRQGVTLEVFGEGSSMGPLNESMKEEMLKQQGEHPNSTSPGPPFPNISNTLWTGESHPTSLRLWEQPLSGNMSLAITTAHPHPKSWSRCVPWCVRPWSKEHWE